MREATIEEMEKHFSLMNITDYCCKCLNFKPDVQRFLGENGAVENWIYCARYDTCPAMQRELR